MDDIGIPTMLTLADLRSASQIVLLDENEHRPMLMNMFPDWVNRVEYWNFEDDYLVSPELILPALQEKILRMVELMESNSMLGTKTGS